jgi:hypothetical protein
LGPGQNPFPGATVRIDIENREGMVVDLVMDVDGGACGPWPFGDDEFVGGYARHVFEDLSEPSCALREMMRVCRKGYVETPSVQAECSRGVDGGETNGRGYNHHHWLVWVDLESNTLVLMPKILVLNLVCEFKNEMDTVRILESDPIAWNSYYFWDKNDPKLQPRFRIVRDHRTVLQNVNAAWGLSLQNIDAMRKKNTTAMIH